MDGDAVDGGEGVAGVDYVFGFYEVGEGVFKAVESFGEIRVEGGRRLDFVTIVCAAVFHQQVDFVAVRIARELQPSVAPRIISFFQPVCYDHILKQVTAHFVAAHCGG